MGGAVRVLIVLALVFAIFFAGVFLARSGYLGQVIKPLLTNKLYLPNLLDGYRSSPQKLFVDVNFKNWQKIAHKRDEALFLNKLVLTADDYVPATIRLEHEAVKVKMRLKGDHVDHLEGDKWSFRFVAKGDQTVLGMKQFSVHHPGTRNFLWEWLFQRALQAEDIVNLRYKFVQVIVNGRDLGIYALEEHFEKRLIEHNRRKNGPIIRFSEDLFWHRFEDNTYADMELLDVETFQSSEIDAFQTRRLLADSTLRPLLVAAIELLSKWRDGQLSTSEVFDCKRLAKIFALSDLFGIDHGLRWHNQRFYFNPIESRLEPVGFDAMAGGLATTLSFSTRYPNDLHMERFFEDSVFADYYLKALEQVSSPEYVEQLLFSSSAEMETSLGILHREFPVYTFDPSNLYTNQSHIRSFLYPPMPFQANYAGHSGNGITIMLGGIQQLEYTIVNAIWNDSVRLYPDTRTILKPKRRREPVTYIQARFILPEELIWHDSLAEQLTLEYTVSGLTEVHLGAVLAFSPYSQPSTLGGLLPDRPNAEEFGFVRVDETNRNILFKSGDWQIDHDLVLPTGYTIRLPEGISLDLINGASLISFSPLLMTGTADKPIRIYSSDSTGQGLLVVKAEARSHLERVNFVNLSNPAKSNWGLTGAVTFYFSPVDLVDCFFGENRSEDALNIIKTDYQLIGTTFSHNMSDAFDADFCKGEITDCSFFACGNDGIDVSGSYLQMTDIRIDGAGDKGISLGENSTADGFRISIMNAEIAVASKDNSRLTLDSLYVSNCRIGFTAFQKKPEYGPGWIAVTDFVLSGVELPYLTEISSSIIADGILIKSDQAEVKDILYGVKYGKASK